MSVTIANGNGRKLEVMPPVRGERTGVYNVMPLIEPALTNKARSSPRPLTSKWR